MSPIILALLGSISLVLLRTLFRYQMNPTKPLWIYLLATFLPILATAIGENSAQGKTRRDSTVKNLILFVGDGMGSNVINAARLQFHGKDGSLNIDRFPYTAKIRTSPLKGWVTDSAAAGTAMATGKKTLNGTLSMIPDPKTEGKFLPQTTLLEFAAKKGKKVGLITTTSILDATPAAFYSHVENRKMTENIIKDLSQSPVNLIIGAGWDDLKSQGDLLKNKFNIERQPFSQTLCKNSFSQDKGIIGAFADESLPPAISTDSKGNLTLMALSQLALECLSESNKKGFFLLVESEDVDESLHSHNIPQALYAARELDLAVGQTIQWLHQKGLDQNTLILVTADHDTGGLAINDPVPESGLWLTEKNSPTRTIPLVKGAKYLGPAYPVTRLSTDASLNEHVDLNTAKAPHTSSDVDLFAQGPGAENFHGTMQNTDIFKHAKRLFVDSSR